VPRVVLPIGIALRPVPTTPLRVRLGACGSVVRRDVRRFSGSRDSEACGENVERGGSVMASAAIRQFKLGASSIHSAELRSADLLSRRRI